MIKLSSRRTARIAAAGCFSLFLAAAGSAQQQILENPAKPASPNAGRVVSLKEVSRISEEKGKFMFVQPLEVFTDRAGSVYVQEYNQFLKFDAQGRFVKDLLKKGEGPGELNGGLTNVLIQDNELLLYSSNSYKLLRLDLDGKLLGEKRFVNGFYTMLGHKQDRYVVIGFERSDFQRANGIYEQDYRLSVVSEKGDTVPTPFVLPLTYSLMTATSGGRAGVMILAITNFMPLPVDNRRAFLIHSPDYLIRVIDLEKPAVALSFRRKYERVKMTPPKGARADDQGPKYHNDLCRLLRHKGKLWAVTSTFDEKKGLLVDVFSPEGKYLDNFYLPIFNFDRENPQYFVPMTVRDNFLYVLEPDEDGIISLVKYEIVGE